MSFSIRYDTHFPSVKRMTFLLIYACQAYTYIVDSVKKYIRLASRKRKFKWNASLLVLPMKINVIYMWKRVNKFVFPSSIFFLTRNG